MKNKTKQAARIKEHSQTLLRPSLIAEFYYPSVSSEKNKTKTKNYLCAQTTFFLGGYFDIFKQISKNLQA